MVSCGLDLTVRLWEESFDEDGRTTGEQTSSAPLVNSVDARSPGEEDGDQEMADAEINAEAETPLETSAANTPAQDVTMT
jgi:hypothetical protein